MPVLFYFFLGEAGVEEGEDFIEGGLHDGEVLDVFILAVDDGQAALFQPVGQSSGARFPNILLTGSHEKTHTLTSLRISRTASTDWGHCEGFALGTHRIRHRSAGAHRMTNHHHGVSIDRVEFVQLFDDLVERDDRAKSTARRGDEPASLQRHLDGLSIAIPIKKHVLAPTCTVAQH